MHDQISFPDNPPQLIIIVGPCRTGTTALANNFVNIGITSYMQPIKSMRRALETGDTIVPWRFSLESVAITKETIGPDIPAEFFDPAQILLDLGYPPEKLLLIPIVRDPRQTYASWKRMWGNVDLHKFVKSYELALQIKNRAERIGLKTIPYVHEVIRDNQPSVVVPRLFEKCGITMNGQNATHNWPGLREGGKHIYFYDNPPERFIAGIQERGGYEYKDLFFDADVARLIDSSCELGDIYESFRQSCETALGFAIKAIR